MHRGMPKGGDGVAGLSKKITSYITDLKASHYTRTVFLSLTI